MHNFKELRVWEKAVDLVVETYQVMQSFPQSERFNLMNQMQRAATSIPSNIAEGCGRGSDPSLKNFLGIALGSAYELETQIIIFNRLGFLSEPSYSNLTNRVTEVQRMINGLSNTL